MIVVIILIVVFVFWLYKKSKSDYFFQERKFLVLKFYNLIQPLLVDFGFENIDKFQDAYYYFIDNPKEFDGATIVADNWQVNHLDLCAMVHDYSYLVLSKGIKDRLIFDWEYSQNMRKFKVNWFTAYSRWFLLLLLNVSGIYSLTKIL